MSETTQFSFLFKHTTEGRNGPLDIWFPDFAESREEADKLIEHWSSRYDLVAKEEAAGTGYATIYVELLKWRGSE